MADDNAPGPTSPFARPRSAMPPRQQVTPTIAKPAAAPSQWAPLLALLAYLVPSALKHGAVVKAWKPSGKQASRKQVVGMSTRPARVVIPPDLWRTARW